MGHLFYSPEKIQKNESPSLFHSSLRPPMVGLRFTISVVVDGKLATEKVVKS